MNLEGGKCSLFGEIIFSPGENEESTRKSQKVLTAWSRL
jgi:hypothetical protein